MGGHWKEDPEEEGTGRVWRRGGSWVSLLRKEGWVGSRGKAGTSCFLLSVSQRKGLFPPL